MLEILSHQTKSRLLYRRLRFLNDQSGLENFINYQYKMGSCVSKNTETTRNPNKIPTTIQPLIKMRPRQAPILKQTPQPQTASPQLREITSKAILDKNQKMKVKQKVPTNKEKTKYTWNQQQAIIYPRQLRQIPKEILRTAAFQEKLSWFRMQMETKRVSWQDGSETLKVDRWNILFSSLEGLKNINLYKELKIQFNDEKVDDAGGLLREWMHLCIKEIMSPVTGIFKQCCTDETAYKFIWDNNVVQELAINALSILGLIIGKALLQRVSLNCFLDRTILRQICLQPVHLSDVYSYDKQLYQSWKSILTIQKVEQLYLDGCVYHTHGDNDLEQVQLFPNGKTTMVTNKNRQLYITEIINLYCTKSTQNYLDALCSSIYKVIPPDWLSIFQPYEMEMMLNGPSVIDIKDWRNHTLYEGYSATHDHVKWFWEVVDNSDQEKLKNLLHYCTGSGRVPILGFKYLESNRGEIRQFTVRKVEYEASNPFPKSHTCFNRLQLPHYKTKDELQTRLRTIMSEQISHYGLS